MKFLATTLLALSTLLAGCTATAEGTSPSDSPISAPETIFGHRDRILPLPVSTEPGDQLYVNPMWGIEVVEILVDGQPAFRRPSYKDFDDLNTKPITVHGSSFVYKVRLDFMIFGRFSPDGLGWSFIEYLIPEDAKTLEIAYRLIRSDNVEDKRIYTLKASRIP